MTAVEWDSTLYDEQGGLPSVARFLFQNPINTGMSFVSGAITSNLSFRNPPNVVIQDGLELLLDAGDTDSYSGSGTTWFDRSGNGRDFTISGSPAHTSGESGYFVTADADSISRTGDTSVQPGTGDFTVSAWVLKTELAENAYLCDFGNNELVISAGTAVNNSWRYYTLATGISSPLYTSNGAPTQDDWYNITVTRESGTTTFYVNNVQTSTDTGDTQNINSGNTYVARYGGFTSNNHIGRYAAFMVYHRALTSAELAHNHKVFTGRYLEGPVAWPEVDTWSLDTVPVEFNTETNDGLAGCVWNDNGARLYCATDPANVGKLWYNSPNYTTPYVPEDDTSASGTSNLSVTRPREMGWADNGTAVIVAHFTGTNNIAKYTHTGTAYNFDTGDINVTASQTFTATSSARSLYVKADGTKLWYTSSTFVVYEVNMSTPWDLSTASMGNNSGSFIEGTAHCFKWSPDGLKAYMLASTDVLYEYTAGTAFDITDLTYTGRSLNVANSRNATSFDISPDATKMVVCYYSATATANELAYYTA